MRSRGWEGGVRRQSVRVAGRGKLGSKSQGVWACEFQSTVSVPRPVRGAAGKVGGENSLRVPGQQGFWWVGGSTCSDPPRGLCTGCCLGLCALSQLRPYPLSSAHPPGVNADVTAHDVLSAIGSEAPP